jgi:GNAT superfamily N-acetyltransferase
VSAGRRVHDHWGPECDDRAVSATTIRPRHDRDLPGCVTAMRQVHLGDGYPANWPADPARFLASNDEFGAWVALAGEDIVGHMSLGDGKTEIEELHGTGLLAPAPMLGISRLFVSPGARGQGLARRLLAVAAGEASQRDRDLILSVVDDGRCAAVAMYEHLGWRRIATLQADWTLPDGNRALMRYYLGPDS